MPLHEEAKIWLINLKERSQNQAGKSICQSWLPCVFWKINIGNSFFSQPTCDSSSRLEKIKNMNDLPSVIVIGAGISGLAAASRLFR